MLKRRVYLLILFISFCKSLNAKSNNSGINEFWQEFYVYHQFNEKIRSDLLINNLYSSQLGNYDWFLEASMTIEAKKWLDIGVRYRQEYYKFNDNIWKEFRPAILFSVHTTMGVLNFRNRHRFELRMFETEDTHFRYRPDIKITTDRDWTTLKLRPYVIEEVFISKRRMVKNRVYLGVDGKIGRIEPGIYFLIQADHVIEKWDYLKIIGIRLGIEI